MEDLARLWRDDRELRFGAQNILLGNWGPWFVEFKSAWGCREIWPANCATPAQQRSDANQQLWTPSKESAITIPGCVAGFFLPKP